MFHIAICDNEEEELQKTEHFLKEYQDSGKGMEYTIEKFSSAYCLLEQIQEHFYLPDILLLDIYMPGENGIEIAKKIRKEGFSNPIVFLTTSREHALDAYEVDASQYLVKPVERERFFSVLDKIFSDVERVEKKYVILHAGRRFYRMQLREIVYCEAQGNYQCVHLQDGTEYNVRMTMTDLHRTMRDVPEFVRVGAAYLVNLSHVNKLSAQELIFDTGDGIHLPRGVFPLLKEQYFQYYFGK